MMYADLHEQPKAKASSKTCQYATVWRLIKSQPQYVSVDLGMSLKTFQEIQKDGVFPQELVASALDQVLLCLNLLHKASVIHTSMFIHILRSFLWATD